MRTPDFTMYYQVVRHNELTDRQQLDLLKEFLANHGQVASATSFVALSAVGRRNAGKVDRTALQQAGYSVEESLSGFSFLIATDTTYRRSSAAVSTEELAWGAAWADFTAKEPNPYSQFGLDTPIRPLFVKGTPRLQDGEPMVFFRNEEHAFYLTTAAYDMPSMFLYLYAPNSHVVDVRQLPAKYLKGLEAAVNEGDKPSHRAVLVRAIEDGFRFE